MRYILPVLLLTVVVLAGCSKSDRELINGTWKIVSVANNGETLFSTDKASQKKAIERNVEKQMRQMSPEARTPEQEEILRKVFEQHMSRLAEMTLEIKDDNTFIMNSYNGSSMEATNGTLTFDEGRHLLELKSNLDEKFTYRVTETELILVANEGNGSTRLAFRR